MRRTFGALVVRVVFFGFPVTGVLTDHPSVRHFMRRFEGVVQRQLLVVVLCRIVQPAMLPVAVYLPRHMHCDLSVIAGPEPAFALNARRKGSVSVTPRSCVLA